MVCAVAEDGLGCLNAFKLASWPRFFPYRLRCRHRHASSSTPVLTAESTTLLLRSRRRARPSTLSLVSRRRAGTRMLVAGVHEDFVCSERRCLQPNP